MLAKETVRERQIGETEFERLSAIKILNENKNERIFTIHNPFSPDKTVCYNPKLLNENGWCYVEENVGWGFCSPSCNFMDKAVGYIYILYI